MSEDKKNKNEIHKFDDKWLFILVLVLFVSGVIYLIFNGWFNAAFLGSALFGLLIIFAIVSFGLDFLKNLFKK